MATPEKKLHHHTHKAESEQCDKQDCHSLLVSACNEVINQRKEIVQADLPLKQGIYNKNNEEIEFLKFITPNGPHESGSQQQ